MKTIVSANESPVTIQDIEQSYNDRCLDPEQVQELIYCMAKRASDLSEVVIQGLREHLSTDSVGSAHAARQEFLGHTKGQLIEIILLQEYLLKDHC